MLNNIQWAVLLTQVQEQLMYIHQQVEDLPRPLQMGLRLKSLLALLLTQQFKALTMELLQWLHLQITVINILWIIYLVDYHLHWFVIILVKHVYLVILIVVHHVLPLKLQYNKSICPIINVWLFALVILILIHHIYAKIVHQCVMDAQVLLLVMLAIQMEIILTFTIIGVISNV